MVKSYVICIMQKNHDVPFMYKMLCDLGCKYEREIFSLKKQNLSSCSSISKKQTTPPKNGRKI